MKYATILSFLVGGCLIQPLDADCEGLTCTDCAERLGCGWCEGVGCTRENASSACEARWFGDSCPKECRLQTSCDACVEAPNCGWCENRCLAGAREGALQDACAATSWAFDACENDADPCRALDDCVDCDRSGCGWCGDTRGCYSGNADGMGTAQNPATFECSQWTTELLECIDLECGLVDDCRLCTEVGCKWCAGSGGFCTFLAFDRCPGAYLVDDEDERCPSNNNCDDYTRELGIPRACMECESDPGCVLCERSDSVFCAPRIDDPCDIYDVVSSSVCW